MLVNHYISNIQQNDEGICYKNTATFESDHDAICYIDEYGITELSKYKNEDVSVDVINKLKGCRSIETHNSIIESVRERANEFADCSYYNSMSEEEIAREILNHLNGGCVDACIDRMCWC